MDRHRIAEARKRALSWLDTQRRSDGSFSVGKDNLRCYLKAPLAYLMGGDPYSAHDLLTILKDRYLTPEGDFRTGERKYTSDAFNLRAERNYYLYGNGWATVSAHVNNRFEISYPALEYVLKCQDVQTGGFYSRRIDDDVEGMRREDVASTSSCGYALLCTGRLTEARKAGDFFIRLRELQPHGEAFYLSYTQGEGLHTAFPDDEAGFNMVDRKKSKQSYWHLAYASAFLGKLFLACADKRYLAAASDYFDFISSCSEDRTSFFGYWKVGWAASLLYSMTGEERYRGAAETVVDGIARSQSPEGSWPLGKEIGLSDENDDLTIDVTSELVVWLTEIPRLLGMHTLKDRSGKQHR